MHFKAVLLALMILPSTLWAQGFNAGFVQGLWYSDTTVFVGAPVRIYVAIRNNTGADMTGRVEFFDNGISLGRSAVSAIDGHIVESWADWVPSFGSHTIKATLTRIELHHVGATTTPVEVTASLAEDVIFVDYDTDGDGAGNDTDSDDDGDGQSDQTEKLNGTDPLVHNKPDIVTEKPDEVPNTEEATPQDSPSERKLADNKYPEGLEQYLTHSPARTALTGLSQMVENSKRALDGYRERRAQAAAEASDPMAIAVNDDGFGDITRSSSTKRELERPEIKKGGIADTVLSAVKSVANIVYTTLLSAASLYLSHPLYFQLTLLLLILFGIYKLARRFGERRS